MGGSQNEGKVEVYYNGTWGTLCDFVWGLNEAGVVCRQLGFRGAGVAEQSRSYDQGSVAISFDDLSCSGVESSLFSCSHTGVRSEYRNYRCHTEVRCKLEGENNTEAENE